MFARVRVTHSSPRQRRDAVCPTRLFWREISFDKHSSKSYVNSESIANHLFCMLLSAGAVTECGEVYHMAQGLEELQLHRGRERGWQRTRHLCTIVMKPDHGIYDSKDVQVIIVKWGKSGELFTYEVYNGSKVCRCKKTLLLIKCFFKLVHHYEDRNYMTVRRYYF